MARVSLRTLGCRLNQAESFEMCQGLVATGFSLVEPSEDPDVVIVNTCTVTADSSRSSRRLITRSVRENPTARIVVTGCYAVAAPEEVATIDGVDDVVPNKDKDAIVEFLSNAYFPKSNSMRRMGMPATPAAAMADGADVPCAPMSWAASPGPPVPPRVTLKVQTGCDEMCTFCIVPYTRGGLASRRLSELVSAAQSLAERGAAEITLSGVHLGKYGIDGTEGLRLYDLVCEMLESLPERVRLRLSSIEVTCVDDRLVEMMAADSRLCRHLHIPLQSGDDSILAAMGRPYDAGRYLEVAERVKDGVDGIAITTDIMVGFPGETPQAFEKTLKVIHEVGFAKLHVFRYSQRENTPATALPEHVSEDEKKVRSRIARELGDTLRLEFHRKQASAGLLEGVLIEGHGPAAPAAEDSGDAFPFPRPSLYGITDNYIKVETSGPAGTAGRLVRVVPSEVGVECVKGDLIIDSEPAEGGS